MKAPRQNPAPSIAQAMAQGTAQAQAGKSTAPATNSVASLLGATPNLSPLPGLSPSGAVSLTKRLAAVSRWRETLNPLQALTLRRGAWYAETYYRGQMADLQWLYFFIEQTDADLFALVDRRTARLKEMDYDIVIADEAKKKNGALAAEQKSCLEETYNRIDNLYEAIEHTAMATFRGYSHCEKWYNEQGELSHLEVVDQWNVVRDGLKGAWKYNPQALMTSFFGLGDDMLIVPENYVIRTVPRHINRIALRKFILGLLVERNWDAFLDIFGIPGGVIIGPPNVNDDKAPLYEAAAREIAEGGSGYLPNGSDYKPNDQPRGGSNPFESRLKYLTEKLILVGTGGQLTMLAAGGGMGGGHQGKTHADVFEQLAGGEARTVSELFKKQVSGPILTEEFPGQPQLASLRLAPEDETNLTETTAQIAALATAGYQVSPEEVTEKTGFTVTLKPTPAAPGADDEDDDPDGDEPQDSLIQAAVKIANRRFSPSMLRTYREMCSLGSDPLKAFARCANRATPGTQPDADMVALAARGSAKLGPVERRALQPILRQLATIEAIADPAGQRAALEKFHAALPGRYAEILKTIPEAAAVLAQVIAPAVVAGFAGAAREKKNETAKP